MVAPIGTFAAPLRGTKPPDLVLRSTVPDTGLTPATRPITGLITTLACDDEGAVGGARVETLPGCRLELVSDPTAAGLPFDVNQRLPSGPRVIPHGSSFRVRPLLYSVITPAGVISPTAPFPLLSV